MNINGREIGSGHPPYIVGEVSGEHRGSFENARDIIRALKEAGADAAKLQHFGPYRLAEARGGADKVLTEGLWAGRSLLSIYCETVTPKSWFPDLFAYAKNIGITLFSSVFDEDGVDYLETLGCPTYKVASREAADVDLVKAAASTGKPVIISTGTATEDDLGRSVAAAAKHTNQIALLYCVSEYPTRMESLDFDEIGRLRHRFQVPVGFSDHTVGIDAAVEAVKAGACIIEKHITLSRAEGGLDAAFSLEPHELKELVQRVKDAR